MNVQQVGRVVQFLVKSKDDCEQRVFSFPWQFTRLVALKIYHYFVTDCEQIESVLS